MAAKTSSSALLRSIASRSPLASAASRVASPSHALRAASSSSSRALSSVSASGSTLTALKSTSAISNARHFSQSVAARGQGESDNELSSSLAEEIKYEQEEASSAGDDASEPEFLTNFKKEGTWRMEEKPGGDEIALTREFGNESIRVLFSIGDLDSSAAVPSEEEGDLAGASEGEADSEETNFPVRCAITISKPNKGALNIDAQAQDGEFLVEAISFYSDAKLASDLTVEADWARRGLYVGPQFETLDEKVQEQFYTYLEERGISTELALFIPELAEWKEQREYCKWLENVKAFVDA